MEIGKMSANMEPERDRELAEQAHEDEEMSAYEVLWHDRRLGRSGYERTTIEAPGEPLAGEAAQIVSVIEDVAQTEIRVDAISEVNDDE